MDSPRAAGLLRILAIAAIAAAAVAPATLPARPPSGTPEPLANAADADDWIFVFKLGGSSFPTPAPASCMFGGKPQKKRQSQDYAFARASSSALVSGVGLAGTSTADPLGASFAEIYGGSLNFVAWNDQFYRHPKIKGCTESCGGPWGHSKGIVAWDNLGQGIVLQVTTPSWPGSGTAAVPRVGDGNTLGCVSSTNDILYSQHFFALKLSPADTASVLEALGNSSVVTDVSNPQLARIGGPPELQALALALGRKSDSTSIQDVALSTGVRLISKPSALHVPPWQMVSSLLGGESLRTATWWAAPRIPTTELGRQILCWRSDLPAPGRVEVALDGRWNDKKISLKGGGNHAKLGISLGGPHHYVIFGDLNQQGRLTGKCASSQNGRGGLFFVVDDVQLHADMTKLLAGATAPLVIKSRPKRKPAKSNP